MKHINPLWRWSTLATCMVVAATPLTGCGDDDEVTTLTTTSSTTASGTGGATTTTTSSGTGGGMGGAGGGTGGGGGSPTNCLAASEYDAVFTVADATLCVVGKYTTTETAGSFTWGRHGGPVLTRQVPDGGASVDDADVVRLTPPMEPTGALTAATETYNVDITNGTEFLGSQILDVPGTNWSLLSYTGPFPGLVGEVIAFDGTQEALRVPAVGFFFGAFVTSATGTRLLSTGLTALGDGDTNNQLNGLYRADICAGPMFCTTPAAASVEAWGGASGAVATDSEGNAFATQLDLGTGMTELRGFDAASIAPGSTSATGVSLATYAGSGSSLVALPPTSDDSGWVMTQPVAFPPPNFTPVPEDVIAHRFTAPGGTITVDGTPSAILTLAADPKPQVSLTLDPQDRIWVGVPDANGTTFYLLARQ